MKTFCATPEISHCELDVLATEQIPCVMTQFGPSRREITYAQKGRLSELSVKGISDVQQDVAFLVVNVSSSLNACGLT
jgi:hypothetical protein